MNRPLRGFLLVATLGVMTALSSPPDLAKPLEGRLRAGYMGTNDMKVLPEMSKAGMNAALVKFGNLAGPDVASYAAAMKPMSEATADAGLAFLPVLNWWGGNEPVWAKGFNPFVTAKGDVLKDTPCPYTPDFWDRVVVARLVAVVRALAARPPNGICLDLEMYGAKKIFYEGECFCDQCFRVYLQRQGLPETVPSPADRNTFVARRGDADLYRTLQRDRARALATSCRDAIQRERPGVRLGVLHLDLPKALHEGIALGFGTPQLPVLALTEQTYATGYTSYVEEAQKRFRALGSHVDLVVGIFQSKFPADRLAAHLFQSARASYGYWIFTMSTFTNPDYLSLPGDVSGYWQAIRTADAELDRAGGRADFRSTLRPEAVEAVAFVPPPPWGLFRKLPYSPRETTRGTAPPVTLRKANVVYFFARAGETMTFVVTCKQLGRYPDPVSVGLASPGGDQLARGVALPGRSTEISARAASDGVYGLVLQAGMNVAEIERASHSVGVDIGPTADGAFFALEVPPLFVAPTPGVRDVRLQFEVPLAAQAVNVRLFNEKGRELWTGIVDGKRDVSLQNEGGLLRLVVERLPGHVLQDFHVRALDGVIPIAAPSPAGLLNPKAP